jgi:hypothetical protein
MAQPRLAFTAEFCGDQAVVCRATENCPGPVAEEQSGVFESWTQAMAFARELNQGLDIHPDDVRQILTSAYLARQEVLCAAEAVVRVVSSFTVLTCALTSSLPIL